MNRLLDRCRAMTIQQLVETIHLVHNQRPLTDDQIVARAAMLMIYEEKMGEEAADSLLDALGL